MVAARNTDGANGHHDENVDTEKRFYRGGLMREDEFFLPPVSKQMKR